MNSLRVAAASWQLRPIRGDGDFFGHFHDLVTIAHEEGAEVVVFPEFHTLELLNLAHDLEERDIPKYLIQFAEELEAWIDRISRSSGMIIVGGSHLRETPEGIKIVCAVGNGVDGLMLVEKQHLTAYERNFWRLQPGSSAAALPDPRLSVALGSDIEHNKVTTKGASIQMLPSAATGVRDFQRTRWAAHAFASEALAFVVQASLVGALDREPARQTYGASAIITPCYEPFLESAILSESVEDEESVIVRTLDLEMLESARVRYAPPLGGA